MKTSLPVLVLEDIVLFPHNEVRLEIDSNEDRELISLAENYYNKHILIVNGNDFIDKMTSLSDFPSIGVLGYINMKIDLPNNTTRVVIRGLKRVKVDKISKTNDCILSLIRPIDFESLDYLEEMAYSRSLIKQFEYYIDNNPSISNSILSQVVGINDVDKLTDILVNSIPLSYEDRLKFLYELDPTVRASMILDKISEDLKIIRLENDLNEKVSRNIEESQREYILQEKLKIIKEELGLGFDKDSEVVEIKKDIDKLKAPKKIKDRLYDELKRYEATPVSSPEVAIIRNYIDCLLSLPWHNKTVDNKDLNDAYKKLNKTHYGLDDIKDRIIEYLALSKKTNNANSPVICFVGPPGVGKTTLAKSIADAMNRKYTKISVGGINDEAEIVGHRRAYMGSSPGKIITGMKKAGSINPVFVIDEIDKMTKDIKGDPASSLLEVLDKEQNYKFVDHYVDEEYDLSQVMFICTANYVEQIPNELYDRLEIIELSSYTEYEKLHIAKEYIIPKSIKNCGLSNKDVLFDDEAILKIINCYTKEAGVRDLERQINTILRKIVKEIVVLKKTYNYEINVSSLDKYLGKEKYSYYNNNIKDQVGIVNAMGYSVYGGDILPIEVNHYPGDGKIITTGSLGDVFVESTSIALSYIKSNCDEFNIDFDLLKNSDIHIHVPEGAVKKDGPSAGIAITSALISAFSDKKVSSNISMTGEITLRGNVLPIGGLKEKVIGAKRAGIKKIFIPKDNLKDLDELSDEIKDGINFVLVSNYIEVFKKIFKSNKK